jgi:Ni/Fe-hydrogenase subunit HybB-like protein
MWFERYIILISSLSQDFLPASWVPYSPTLVDIGIYVGTFGLFFCGLLLFVRYIPIIAVNEVKPIARAERKKTDKSE